MNELEEHISSGGMSKDASTNQIFCPKQILKLSRKVCVFMNAFALCFILQERQQGHRVS